MSLKKTLAVAGIAAAAATGTGTAIGASGDSVVTVAAQTTLKAGATAPFDAPGAKAIRRGKVIPAGYELIGRKVTYQRGRQTAGAALRFNCPSPKKIRTFGITGNAGFSSTTNYVGHAQTYVMSLPHKPGTSSGVVYAVCR